MKTIDALIIEDPRIERVLLDIYGRAQARPTTVFDAKYLAYQFEFRRENKLAAELHKLVEENKDRRVIYLF